MANQPRNTPAAQSAKTAPAGLVRPRKSFAINARESLESIVVAFALAFIFRAFIVEAFVIPTGSMAATLYGQQVTHTCSTCGFEYAHDAGPLPLSHTNQTVNQGLVLKCPNCSSMGDQVSARELVNPSSGDRILVHKWPFSVDHGLGPHRWEVTVFKDPHNGTVNYIKRLIGLPGEMLEIIHGDVYAAPLADIAARDPGLIADMDQLRKDVYHHAYGGPILQDPQVAARYAAINQRLIPFLKIQRKAVDAPEAQKSLWFNVYNHDYLPNYQSPGGQGRVGWSAMLFSVDALQPEQLNSGQIPPELLRGFERHGVTLPSGSAAKVEEVNARWRIAGPDGYLVVKEDNRLAVYDAAAAAAWNTTGREITFASDSAKPLAIRFGGKPIDDFYAYNFLNNPRYPTQARVPVGDVRLSFTWFPMAGDGGLSLRMNRHNDEFTARMTVDGGTEMLHRAIGDARKPQIIGQQKLDPFAAGKAVTVEFSNVDFRASLVINGQEVLATTDQQYTPNIAELLSRPSEDPGQTRESEVFIGASKLQCRITHVVLQRDVYYRSAQMTERTPPPAQPGQPVNEYQLRTNPYADWPGWGTQGWPIMLRQQPYCEYFMLGDNSPGSKDSRLWWEIGPHLQHLGDEYQVGTVPQDQLIGQAFFVYWPGGYRRSWTAGVGLIPDFGRMRWIR